MDRSDSAIILVPIPILMNLQVAFQRKIILILMFSSGLFIMICSVLRAYYSLGDINNLPTALGWAERECFVAAIVTSLPGIKPLLRNTRILGSSRFKTSRSYGSSGYNHFGSRVSGKSKPTMFSSRGGGSSKTQDTELDTVVSRTGNGRRSSYDESEERMLDGTSNIIVARPSSPKDAVVVDHDPFSIHVTTEYGLSVERGDPHGVTR